jgi:hypothetical protein
MSKWTKLLVHKISGSTLWRHADGYYQITLGSVPFSEAGYFNVEWLVKAKGLPAGTFDYFYTNNEVTSGDKK